MSQMTGVNHDTDEVVGRDHNQDLLKGRMTLWPYQLLSNLIRNSNLLNDS